MLYRRGPGLAAVGLAAIAVAALSAGCLQSLFPAPTDTGQTTAPTTTIGSGGGTDGPPFSGTKTKTSTTPGPTSHPPTSTVTQTTTTQTGPGPGPTQTATGTQTTTTGTTTGTGTTNTTTGTSTTSTHSTTTTGAPPRGIVLIVTATPQSTTPPPYSDDPVEIHVAWPDGTPVAGANVTRVTSMTCYESGGKDYCDAVTNAQGDATMLVGIGCSTTGDPVKVRFRATFGNATGEAEVTITPPSPPQCSTGRR